MSRPSIADSIVRRDMFAALIAEDMRDHRAPRADVHARTARLDVNRALRLSWDPGFLAQVARMANMRQAA